MGMVLWCFLDGFIMTSDKDNATLRTPPSKHTARASRCGGPLLIFLSTFPTHFPFFKISCAARRLILKYLILVIMSLYIFFFLLCLLVVYINMLTQLNYTQIAVFATAKSIPASQLLLHIPNH